MREGRGECERERKRGERVEETAREGGGEVEERVEESEKARLEERARKRG